MEKDNKEIIVLRPANFEDFLIFSIAAIFAVIFIKGGEPFPPGIVRMFKVFLFILILLVQFLLLFHMRVVIRSDKISFPGIFPFTRINVDIASIRKIIKYPSLADGNQSGEYYTDYHREISITYSGAKSSIRLMSSYWGSELINELIEVILERNENVQIVDFERMFNEKKL
jgi:hypothetical protein